MKNKVKNILIDRGFKSVQLTDDMLKKLEVDTPHRFNKIWHNEAEMTQSEIIAFKEWLQLTSLDDLFEAV